MNTSIYEVVHSDGEMTFVEASDRDHAMAIAVIARENRTMVIGGDIHSCRKLRYGAKLGECYPDTYPPKHTEKPIGKPRLIDGDWFV